MPGRGFIIFWIFLLFFSEFSFPGRVWTEFWSEILLLFWNFLARVEYKWNSGVKFCFHFFGLSHPVLAKNNVGKRFYNFLNFFTIFFVIFFSGSSMNGILEWNFVFTFSAYPHRFWIKIMPGRGFKIFWIFLLFFFGIFFPGSSMNGILE